MENKYYYKELTLEIVEKAVNETIEKMEKYGHPIIVIFGDINKEIDKEIIKTLQEYNTDTSAQHLSSKEYGDEIV